MLRTYKYRLYPKQEQLIPLAKHFGCVRYIYNWALEMKIRMYQKAKKRLSTFEVQRQLTRLKHQDATSWLSEVNSQSLQQSVKHLENAFTKFFREKKGFPKFKSKHKKQSFSCPQNVKVNFEEGTVQVPKIGKVKTIFSREFKGTIKTCTISKTRTNKYFVSILVETGQPIPKKPKIDSKKTIGIDLGLKDFAICSDKTKIANPKFLRNDEQRLRVLQRRASKKIKGSKNRAKANLCVAIKHEKIRNRRTDFLHKASTRLIRENQTICLETLNVSGMMQNHKLAKSISDVSWSEFVRMLEYKAEWYGKNILRIGKFEPSSKICSCCGWIQQDLTLKQRKWKCKECGVLHDRDVNAAINIKNFALQKQNLIGYSGSGRSGESGELSGSNTEALNQKEFPLL